MTGLQRRICRLRLKGKSWKYIAANCDTSVGYAQKRYYAAVRHFLEMMEG